MSRAGPVSRAASVCRDDFQAGITWPGCHVIAELIFVAFNRRAEVLAN